MQHRRILPQETSEASGDRAPCSGVAYAPFLGRASTEYLELGGYGESAVWADRAGSTVQAVARRGGRGL